MGLSPLKLTVCISGRGSNLSALLAQQSDRGTYEITTVFSDQPSASGLNLARERGIDAVSLDRSEFNTFKEFKQALFEKLDQVGGDLIVLAGFMVIVPEWFTKKWFGKLINIHPALLPKFPGLHTHQRALEAGERTHGCTVHLVDAGVDTGPILAQSSLEILPEDDEDTLSEKVLALEHKLYPWCVAQFCKGGVKFEEGRIVWSDAAAREARALGFEIFPLI